jgi:signal transduction histidine kinase
MKILGEELTEIGRRTITFAPLLLLGLLVLPILLAAAAQSRFERADERLHNLQVCQQALGDFMALIAEAESDQRAFLLTGEIYYLQPYSEAVGRTGQALEKLRSAYGGGSGTGAEGSSEVHELQDLTGKELQELAEAIAQRQSPTSSGSDGPRAGVGAQTMERISTLVGSMREHETGQLSAATERWRSELAQTRWITAAGALINVGLIVLATRLLIRDMRRRALQATALRDQKQELERQVAARTSELTALSTHLQGVSEQEKSALSRELHDELGGLLVAARMDLSWLQQRLPTSDPAIEQRFRRIHESLSAGVDLKRRVVEELRPTLLDNMGLFAALRWQFKETCRRTGLRCTETIPEAELKFHPDAAIGVFRVAQEALTNILKHADARSADLTIEIHEDTLLLRISDDGRGIPLHRLQTLTSHGLAAMRHRITALGGTWEVHNSKPAGTMITALIPLRRMLLEGAPAGA